MKNLKVQNMIYDQINSLQPGKQLQTENTPQQPNHKIGSVLHMAECEVVKNLYLFKNSFVGCIKIKNHIQKFKKKKFSL